MNNYDRYIELLLQIIETRDIFNNGHSKYVCRLSLLIGEEMGLNSSEKRCLEEGALLHDIGKVMIPDNVLNKPGFINDMEREIIEEHPGIGTEMLSEAGFPQKTIEIIKYHHERFDGCGYPEGLKGKDIPILARIVTVAVAFAAMTKDQYYSKAKIKEEALEEIKNNSGVQFCPQVVESFFEII